MDKEEKKLKKNEEIKTETTENTTDTANKENNKVVQETSEVENNEVVQDATNVENNETITNNENAESNIDKENNVAAHMKKKTKMAIIIGCICALIVAIIIGVWSYISSENQKAYPQYYNGTYSFYIEDSWTYATGLVQFKHGVVNFKKFGADGIETGSYEIGKEKKITLVLGKNIYSGKLNGKDIEFSLNEGENPTGRKNTRNLTLKYEGDSSIYDEVQRASAWEEKLADNIKKGKEYIKHYEEETLAKTSNPYTIVKDYDGIYSCYVEDKNSDGDGVYQGAYIAFEDGKTYLRSIKNSDRDTLGYFGLENEKLVFELYNSNKYEGIKDGKNIKATLISGYNITANKNNKELILTYVDSIENKDKYLNEKAIKEYGESIKEKGSAFLKKANKEKEAEKERKAAEEVKKYKDSCQTYTYNELARNPSAMKGKPVKVTGKVIQSMKSTYGNSVTLRVNITKTGSYYTYYTDTVYVTYTYPDSSAERILEDDIITIYGDSTGETSYQSTLSGTVTIPSIDAKYIERN